MIGPTSHAVWTLTTLALYSNGIADAGAVALTAAVEGRLAVREDQLDEIARDHGWPHRSQMEGGTYQQREQAELEALGPVVPPVNVLLFGHMIQSEEVAQRALDTPGIEVYSSIELGQSVDEQVRNVCNV